MQVSNYTNELYSKVTDKKYSTARDYLSSTYGEPKVLYYKQNPQEEKKEKRKQNIRFLAFVVAIIALLSGISAQVIKHNQYNLNKFGKLVGKKTKNVMSNFLNIKDDYWDKFAKKAAEVKLFGFHPLAFIDKIGQKMTNLYKKSVCSVFESDWNNKRKVILEKAKKENVNIEIPEFKNWYNSLYDEIYGNLHIEGQRVTDNLINKDIFKKVTRSNIADNKISEVKDKALRKIFIPEGASTELKEKIWELNNCKHETAKILVPKLRDISEGSAPTDLLTQIIALVSLGTVAATSDTDEKKQFVIIRMGIPLIAAVCSTTIATLKAISGSSALLFGLTIGEIASFTAKKISDAYLKRRENKSEIV